MTLTQQIAVVLFVLGVGYAVGKVHAQQAAHEGLEGHVGLSKRVQTMAVTQASVAATLAALEKREAICHPGG